MSSSVSHNVVSPSVFGSLFSGLNNCNVTVSPQNLIVNVGTSVTSSPRSNFVPVSDCMHCLAGCMYDPVIPVHCTARVSLWQPLWSVPLAPVRAYDRCTEGWTDTGSENEPSFKRKRLSLQNRARNPSRNPRASRGGPVILRRAN